MTDQLNEKLEKVRVALGNLGKDGKISNFEPVSHLNGSKKDFLVFCGGHMPMPLKVKVSKASQKIHEKKYPSVPSIMVGPLGMPAVLEEKLIEMIERFSEGKILHV